MGTFVKIINGPMRKTPYGLKPTRARLQIKTCCGGWKTTWLELANVAKRWKTWLGRKFEVDQNQADSIQLEPSGWRNDTQLHPSWKLGSSWLEWPKKPPPLPLSPSPSPCAVPVLRLWVVVPLLAERFHSPTQGLLFLMAMFGGGSSGEVSWVYLPHGFLCVSFADELFVWSSHHHRQHRHHHHYCRRRQ